MTISNSTVRNRYLGNDVTDNFDFDFEIEVNTYLEVYLTDSDGVETQQTLGVHYTVNDVGVEAGGDIDMVTPPATGETLTLVKAQPITQNTAISDLATFRTAAFESALDWIMKGMYRVLDMASRSPQLRNADADGTGKYDFNGNQAINLGTPTDDGDIATVGWSETRYAEYIATVASVLDGTGLLPLVGGTMTGDIVLAGDPDADLKAATKQYVDGLVITSDERTKLGTVATNADVTSTAAVTTAGALMDSELANLAAVKAINQSLVSTAQPTFKAVTETRFAVTGTTPAIDPADGGVQTWTLSGNSTPTDNLGDGESVTLHIDDGTAHTITWTSLVDEWIGGAAPTLPLTGYAVIELWKINTTVYAAYVGDLS